MKRLFVIAVLALLPFVSFAADEQVATNPTPPVAGITGPSNVTDWIGKWGGGFKALTGSNASMLIDIQSVKDGEVKAVVNMGQTGGGFGACGGNFPGIGTVNGSEILLKIGSGNVKWCEDRVIEGKREGKVISGRLRRAGPDSSGSWTTFSIAK